MFSSVNTPWKKYASKSEEALSIYPSELIWDNLPEKVKLLLSSPEENCSVFFKVLKLPILEASDAKASFFTESVCKFKLAPNAEEPFVEVPTPLCNWIDSTEEAKSGKFTQKVPWDSESLYGIPLIVTLTLVASLPRTRMPVYPIPAPASLVVTTPGK